MKPSELLNDDGTPKPSRYVVGIDLGTTNSAIAYVDTTAADWRVEILAIPQLVDAGLVEARDTLPSFHYEPAPGELPAKALVLPWDRDPPPHAVGIFARDHGRLAPGRLIASAKSWLCHSGVDRTAAVLPWRGAADVQRLSPVAVSARYLAHLRAAWDHRFPAEPLANQDVILTLPASFDEVARELTVEAAAEAGLKRIVLIEEPQAAFYSWIDHHRDNWSEQITPGQKILVCDIGGGTSDFTLIRARRGEGEKVQFHRVAVGEHLILGGDNIDLALAHLVERKLGGEKLEPRTWDILVRLCQQMKEVLLGANAPPSYTLNLPGSGSRLLGGSRSVVLTREEVQREILDGFFPLTGLEDRPERRRSGFLEFGLPYASDPAITRYLAAFLTSHRDVMSEETPAGVDPARPDVVLFNGGVFEADVLRERILNVLRTWFPEAAEPYPMVLSNQRLDLAVAHGAAYYGMVRRGLGVRITAGLARTYYIGVAGQPPSALCLVPATAEPGQEIKLDRPSFDLLVSEPVEFPLYVSSTRLADRPGQLVPVDREQMTALPPIRTVLRIERRKERGRVEVELHARLTEIGTLELWCRQTNSDRRWRLQFDVRAATQTDLDAQETTGEQTGIIEEDVWQACRQTLADVFAPQGKESPDRLIRRMTEQSGIDRRDWPMSFLRRIWEALLEMEPGRRKNPVHEARWLNLLGYALRPGYGVAVDDWRVAETWRTVQGKLIFPSASSRTESLILWRRLAGGLSAGQQRAIAEPFLASLRAQHRRQTTGQGKPGDQLLSPHEQTEVWRLVGSLEWLPIETKLELGRIATDLIIKPKLESIRPALAFALGRLGQRVPVYGPLNTVVPEESTRAWREVLMSFRDGDPSIAFALMQLARRTGDRYRDVSDSSRAEIIDWLTLHAAPAHLADLVRDVGRLDQEEQNRAFGESLPKGLQLRKWEE